MEIIEKHLVLTEANSSRDEIVQFYAVIEWVRFLEEHLHTLAVNDTFMKQRSMEKGTKMES